MASKQNSMKFSFYYLRIFLEEIICFGFIPST